MKTRSFAALSLLNLKGGENDRGRMPSQAMPAALTAADP
jgi:hypothetical protein